MQQPLHTDPNSKTPSLQPTPLPPPAAEPSDGITAMYTLALLVAVVILGVGALLGVQGRGWAVLAAGCASLVAVLVAWPLANMIGNSRRQDARRREEIGSVLLERLQQISVLLEVVTEQQLLSDRAKQVAFRDKDRDALRRAIKEDLARRDWEAALALVSDMEKTFGYKVEAEAYREEIAAHREETIRMEVEEASRKIDAFCRHEKWTEALRESERLHRHYPDNDAVQRLPQEIEMRRQSTKRQLLDAWNEAIARKDVDGSIEILKKLDLYLTRQEAESMQEAARSVFKEKLNQLGAQFKLAWQDKRYSDAMRVGETITRDFPNSGIAREVRDWMDSHRRAAEAEVAR